MEKTNTGTQLKMALNLQCAGLSAEDYDFTARFWTYTNRYVDVRKSEMAKDGTAYIAVVDTMWLGSGELKLTVFADIPDADAGGTRREIATCRTGVTLKEWSHAVS